MSSVGKTHCADNTMNTEAKGTFWWLDLIQSVVGGIFFRNFVTKINRNERLSLLAPWRKGLAIFIATISVCNVTSGLTKR